MRGGEGLEGHLSESQIEAILHRALDAGRETPVDSEEQVSAHLEACESCRARIREQAPAMERLAHLKSKQPGARAADCPATEVWIEIAAGLNLPESEAYLA